MKERFKAAWKGWNLNLPVITEKEKCLHISHTLSTIERGSKKTRENLSPPDRRSYVSEASVVFKQPIFKKEHDSLIEEQVYWIAENVIDEKEREFHKGTINGMRIFYEQFKDMDSEHMNNVKEPEKFDKINVMPEYEATI